jgi:hypothetical protein
MHRTEMSRPHASPASLLSAASPTQQFAPLPLGTLLEHIAAACVRFGLLGDMVESGTFGDIRIRARDGLLAFKRHHKTRSSGLAFSSEDDSATYSTDDEDGPLTEEADDDGAALQLIRDDAFTSPARPPRHLRAHRAAANDDALLRDLAALEGLNADEEDAQRRDASTRRLQQRTGKLAARDDGDTRLVNRLAVGGGRSFRLLRLIRAAFTRVSPCYRYEGMAVEEFSEYVAPLVARMVPTGLGKNSPRAQETAAAEATVTTNATFASGGLEDNVSFGNTVGFGSASIAAETAAIAAEMSRQAKDDAARAAALCGALDPASTGYVSWAAFTTVFANRGRSRDPAPEEFTIVDSNGGHHHSMITAILYARSWHSTVPLPPSLDGAFFTGGSDGTVLEWRSTGTSMTLAGKIHSASTHLERASTFSNTSAQASWINTLTVLPGARLFASQAFGHGYIYDLGAASRPLMSVVRTATFKDLDQRGNLLSPGRGSSSGVAGSGASDILSRRTVAAVPTLSLMDFYGDISASCASTSHYLGAVEPLILGSNTGQIAIFNLKRSLSGGIGGSSSPADWLTGGSSLINIKPLHTFTTFTANDDDEGLTELLDAARYRASARQQYRHGASALSARVYQLLDIALDHSLIAVGCDKRGRHFMEVYDYEKMVPKLRLTRPGEGATATADAMSNSRVPKFTRIDVDPAHNLIIASGSTRVAALYTTAFPDPITELEDHQKPILFAALDLGRNQIHVLTEDKALHVYDARMNRKIQVIQDTTLRTPRDTFTAAALDPATHSVVACSNAPVMFAADAESIDAKAASSSRAAASTRLAAKRASPAGVGVDMNAVVTTRRGEGTCVTSEGNNIIIWPSLRLTDAAAPGPTGLLEPVTAHPSPRRESPGANALQVTTASAVSAFFTPADADSAFAPPRKLQPLQVHAGPNGGRCTALCLDELGRRLAVVSNANTVSVVVVASGAPQFTCKLLAPVTKPAPGTRASLSHHTHANRPVAEEISCIRLLTRESQRADAMPKTLLFVGGAKGTLLVVDLTHAASASAEVAVNAPTDHPERSARAAPTVAVPTIGSEGVQVMFHRRVADHGDGIRCLADEIVAGRMLVGTSRGKVLSYLVDHYFTTPLHGLDTVPAAFHDRWRQRSMDELTLNNDGDRLEVTARTLAGSPSGARPAAARGDGVSRLQNAALRELNSATEAIRVLTGTNHIAVLFGSGIVAVYRVYGADTTLEMAFPATGASSACALDYDHNNGTLYVGDYSGCVTALELWRRRGIGTSYGTPLPTEDEFTFTSPLNTEGSSGMSGDFGHNFDIMPSVLSVTQFSTTAYISELAIVQNANPNYLVRPMPPAATSSSASLLKGKPRSGGERSGSTPPGDVSGDLLVVGMSEALCVLTVPVAALEDPVIPVGACILATCALGTSWRGLQTVEYKARLLAGDPAAGRSHPQGEGSEAASSSPATFSDGPAALVARAKASDLFTLQRITVSNHPLESGVAQVWTKPRVGADGGLSNFATNVRPPAPWEGASGSTSHTQTPRSNALPLGPAATQRGRALTATGRSVGSVATSFDVREGDGETSPLNGGGAVGSPTKAAASNALLRATAPSIVRQRVPRRYTNAVMSTARGSTVPLRLVHDSLAEGAAAVSTPRPNTARAEFHHQPAPPSSDPPASSTARRHSHPTISTTVAGVPVTLPAGIARKVRDRKSFVTASSAMRRPLERVLSGDGEPEELIQDLHRVVLSSADLQREIVSAFAEARRAEQLSPNAQLGRALLEHREADDAGPFRPATAAAAAGGVRAAAGRAGARSPPAAAPLSMARRTVSPFGAMGNELARSGNFSSDEEEDRDDVLSSILSRAAPAARKHAPLLASTHLISSPRTRQSRYIHYQPAPRPAVEIMTASVFAAHPPSLHLPLPRPTSPVFVRDVQRDAERRREYEANAEAVAGAVASSQRVAGLAMAHQRTIRRGRMALGQSGAAFSFRSLEVQAVDLPNTASRSGGRGNGSKGTKRPARR